MGTWGRLLFSLSILFICVGAWAEKDFSSWGKYTHGELVAETTGFAPGQVGTIGLKISLKERWHTYWVNPGDSGTPIRLKFKTDTGVKVRRVMFPWPERELTGPLISFAYSNEVLLPIELALSSDWRPGQTVHMTIEAEWLVCDEVCIPAITQLKIDVPVLRLEDVKPSAEFGRFQKARAQTPEELSGASHFREVNGRIQLPLPQLAEGEEVVEFFPFRGSGVSHERALLKDGFLEFEKSNVPQVKPDRIGVAVVRSGLTGVSRGLQFGESGWTFAVDEAGRGGQVWWMLLSAFLGGLILNLMPCVFPILSMKLLSLLKLGQAHAKEVREQNLAYVAGVLISFLAIASVLSLLRSAGQLVGWGFQLQSPVFLSGLIWLFLGLALNLFGAFELDLLNAGFGHRLTRLGGLWGSFFTGVLAVIVASPCTAPFMGAALGFGLGQPLPILFGVFLAIGLGLSFPYLMFVFFPAWTRFLPRPGLWMQILKQLMALPMLATAAWLLWVLMQVADTRSVVLVEVVGGLLVAAILYRGVGRSVLRIGTALFLVGSAVWISTSVNRAAHVEADLGIWEAYSDARLAALKGQNVFVNMTADWCLSCKVNERLVFDDSEVQALLKAKGVTLLKGDWTQRNEEITRFLNRYDRVGVPFYVLYSARHPEGVTLPEVLTKSLFVDWIKSEFP